MKLKDSDFKKVRILRDLVAFKWIKVNKIKAKGLDIYLPDDIIDKGGQGRMGHRYTCEVLLTGPKVTQVKPGDRFLIHEYDKLDQSTPWSEQDVMFCEEGVIPCLLDKETEFMIPAKQITDKMMDKYEDY